MMGFANHRDQFNKILIERAQTTRDFIANKFGYQISDLNLVTDAMNFMSGAKGADVGSVRLAIVGDHAIKLAIAVEWYATSHPRVLYSQHMQLTETGANFAEIARELGLGDHLLLITGRIQSIVGQRTLATALEAVFGAIYLDSGKNLDVVSKSCAMIGLNFVV